MIFHRNASNASKYQIAMDLTLKVEGSLAFCCGNKLLPPFQLQLHCFAEGNNIIEKKLRPWVKKKAEKLRFSVAVLRWRVRTSSWHMKRSLYHGACGLSEAMALSVQFARLQGT